jgi:hypothetical protein
VDTGIGIAEEAFGNALDQVKFVCKMKVSHEELGYDLVVHDNNLASIRESYHVVI